MFKSLNESTEILAAIKINQSIHTDLNSGVVAEIDLTHFFKIPRNTPCEKNKVKDR